jgi:hypothetical protein
MDDDDDENINQFLITQASACSVTGAHEPISNVCNLLSISIFSLRKTHS